MMSGAWTVGAWAVDGSVLGDFALTTGVRGVLLLSVVGGATLLLGRASAARRHLVWTLGMVGLLLLPLAQLAAPQWSVGLPGAGWLEASVAGVGTAPGAAVDGGDAVVGGAAMAVEGGAFAVEEGDVAVEGGAVAPEGAGAATGVARVRPEAAGVAAGAAPDPEGSRTAGAPPSPGGPAPGPDWPLVLLGVWGLGVAVVGGALVAGHGALRGLEAVACPFPGDRVARELSHLAVVMGVGRPVRLLQGDEGQMPMSWGILRPVILLPRGAERWPAPRLRAVLLHELAHVRRRDCLTQLVAELARALHWPNPLAWIGAWRLRVDREHACDDRVLLAGARASAYADELLSLARGFRADRRATRAAVAMARPSNLESRLTAVLAEGRRRTLSGRGAAVTAGAALLLTTAVAGVSAAPGDSGPVGMTPVEPAQDAVPPPAPPAQAVSCGSEPADWQSSSHRRNDDRTQVTWSRPGCEVEVRLDGEVEFDGTFRDVARLGPGARLRMEERDGGTERRLEITPGTGGAPVHAYHVGGEERPFDADARAWYEALLLQLFRRAGFMAEERVAAFLAGGGLPAVFQELQLLQTDHVYARYVQETIRQADLSRAQLEELLDGAVERVDSDHYLAEILEAVAGRSDLSDRMLDTFISASRTIGSDHYRAEVLETALERGDLSDAQVRALLESASEIGSDHYQAEILEGVGDRYALRAELREIYLQAVERIGSDHYTAEVLSGLLERSDLDPEEKATVLRAAARIDSDHYVTGILEELLEQGLGTGALRDAYFEVVESVDSDHYRREALQAMLESEDELSQDQLRRVIESAGVIDSDHHRSELLVEIAEGYRLQGATRDAFVRTMEAIESRHYRGRVAEALLQQGGG